MAITGEFVWYDVMTSRPLKNPPLGASSARYRSFRALLSLAQPLLAPPRGGLAALGGYAAAAAAMSLGSRTRL
jgi:hypothetical protein